MRQSSSRAAAIASSNELFNEAIRRSLADIYMLVTELPEGPYPYAGIPWFSTVFGRDALITASETLWADPQIARGVLFHLAAHQATTINPAADAEPGLAASIPVLCRSGSRACRSSAPPIGRSALGAKADLVTAR
jgi:glycogen debranching enzyme